MDSSFFVRENFRLYYERITLKYILGGNSE